MWQTCMMCYFVTLRKNFTHIILSHTHTYVCIHRENSNWENVSNCWIKAWNEGHCTILPTLLTVLNFPKKLCNNAKWKNAGRQATSKHSRFSPRGVTEAYAIDQFMQNSTIPKTTNNNFLNPKSNYKEIYSIERKKRLSSAKEVRI